MTKDTTLPRSHRAVDVLRQSPIVEMHRSSSGRNLRLKQLSVADGALLSAPNALTPRAPSGRRPESRQRLHSADSNNNGPSGTRDRLLQRSSSFSISAHVLKDLERVRTFTDPEGLVELCENPEHPRCTEDNDQQRGDSSDESEIHWDVQEDVSNNSEVLSLFNRLVQEEERIEDKAVSNFGLWGKAPKNKSMPDAIIFSGSAAEESKPSPSASLPSRVQPLETKSRRQSEIPSVSEMVSQLHVTHPHLAALSVLDIPKTMSLTRSSSPRIGRSGFSSLPDTSYRSATSVTTNNQQVETEVVNSNDVSNPITQWKRGELIGEGTFGKVYKGLNIATGELFALKEIEIHSSPNADQVTQMQKLGEEISLMNNLIHKHIVRYKGSHRSANHFYIFMEYVPGGSIASMLKQFDAFREDLIRIFTRQIVQGVVYLHQMGIIHRDIKGANVLVNEQGVSKLADFGCSKQIPQMLTTSLEESLRSIRGSIPWMAPEVVKQTGHGYKADIWSIGATVIEMATAKHPWPQCHNGLAAMYTIAMATAPPPLPEHLSVEAKEFLRRCFCIDPEERATALELSEHVFLAEKM
ncbi:STE/STE11 protein kinase [Phytophthora megakarya]|uniref:STE/STE11 protein kinase n=1 Tax=Phytophthora megakarya TaxID=4795 RepID=A0A225WA86_9STRA|nr:STE/STE11 protein kinase [Phytophthora megakarya]